MTLNLHIANTPSWQFEVQLLKLLHMYLSCQVQLEKAGESWYQNYKADLACHSIYISLLYGGASAENVIVDECCSILVSISSFVK